MLFCAVVATSLADPEPKKYKDPVKKSKPANTTLTDEERKFLREVEAKFGIKSEAKDEEIDESKPNVTQTAILNNPKLPFPAVIAIEIVNDTNSKYKGKRTIDANLGYGYKTNNGYSYSYFGKAAEDKGRFMIYPYSQEDIPPVSHQHGATEVEITPSKAFELVTVNDDKEGYNYPKPSTEYKTDYNNVKGLVSPPPSYDYSSTQGLSHSFVPSTLYTTYNGHGFSSLSGQFPKVMQNYFVDPSQLLKTPEYQNVGLTNDHLRVHGSTIADQRVVPVLVLRIPSSSLKNPTAELFANLPSNYPLSSYLNNVNLQDLVNQYFKKIGYSFAPQVTTYPDSLLPSTHSVRGMPSNYGRQHYATPQIQPTYTHADNSGVQYSAVQPVMARYPSSYTRHHMPHGHSLYQMPHQQKYEYQYKYVPQSALPQTYYVESQQYNQQLAEPALRTLPETSGHSNAVEVQYETVPQVSSHSSHADVSETYEYRTPEVQSHQEVRTEYEYPTKQQTVETASPSYEHHAGTTGGVEYYSQQEEVQKETVAMYPSQAQAEEAHSQVDTQTYHYQQTNDESDSHGLSLTENYPSKDHTIATVLPVSYNPKTINSGAVQTVSYVTPMPYSSKYKSPYRIMVPQTFLMHPSTEKVAYVNSHSVSAFSQQDYNPEAEYTVGPHYVPPVGKQKPPAYPSNYHSYPKRMTKPEKQESTSMFSRKRERNEKKKSS